MNNAEDGIDPDPQFVRRMYTKILPHHLIYRNYLRPFQILLQTHKTDSACIEARKTSLPQGLMIASKRSINDNTYTKTTMLPREGLEPRAAEIGQHRKNLLNLLRKVNSFQPQQVQQRPNNNFQMAIVEIQEDRPDGFQIAICVCVYSEDSKMLKQTLTGIKENVISLVKSGVRQDAIAVFIFFDGIEKMDPSIHDYFERLQNQAVNLQGNVNYNQAWRDYVRGPLRMPPEEAEESFFRRHILRIIFSEQELRDRQERTFKKVFKEYNAMVQLKEDIIRLKNEKEISFHKLVPKIQEQFIQIVKERNKNRLEDIEEILFNIIFHNKSLQKTICIKAIAEIQIFCNIFLSARNDLAYLFTHQQLIYSKQNIKEEAREEEVRRAQRAGRDYREVPMPPRPGDEQREIQEREISQIYLNLFFTVKYKNQGKLSSHNWFLNGFCKELKPKYMILMDVGLKPHEKAIFSMYYHLKSHPNVGGVCGYMSLKMERTEQEEEVHAEEVDCLTNIAHKIVDIQRAQQIEYHFAHLLDKPFESLFNFIHVLPGAFSGYNMDAIHSSQDKNQTILRKYFESLNDKIVDNHIVESELTVSWITMKVLLPDFISSYFLTTDPNSEEQLLCNENMNLAEDRILCFGIHKNGYDLAYLPDAYSQVDPIKTLHAMLGQRKRWINGSYFAFEKVKQELTQFQKSIGTCEFLLKLQMLYLSLVNAVSYFSVSLFLFTVHISMRIFYIDVLQNIFTKALTSKESIPFFINTMDFIYALVVLTLVYYSLILTYNNKRFKELIYICSTSLGILSIVVIVVLTYSVQDMYKLNLALTSFLTYAVMIMVALQVIPIILYSIMHGKLQLLVQMLFGAISFIYYNPTYLIILNIYALCRMDDISWGTKGIDKQQKSQTRLKQKWRKLKFVHVFKYLLWNFVLSITLISIEYELQTRLIITLTIVIIISLILLIKFTLGFIYSIVYKLKKRETQIQGNPPSKIRSRVTKYIRWKMANEINIPRREREIELQIVAENIKSLLDKSRNAEQY